MQNINIAFAYARAVVRLLGEASEVLITLGAAALAAFGQYVFKSHVKAFGRNISEIIGVLTERHMLGGILIYALSLGVYLYALRDAGISFVYPIFASSFIFVALIAKYVFRERMRMTRVAGILLIVFGIIIVAATY